MTGLANKFHHNCSCPYRHIKRQKNDGTNKRLRSDDDVVVVLDEFNYGIS
jgi:hypothetical protein